MNVCGLVKRENWGGFGDDTKSPPTKTTHARESIDGPSNGARGWMLSFDSFWVHCLGPPQGPLDSPW